MQDYAVIPLPTGAITTLTGGKQSWNLPNSTPIKGVVIDNRSGSWLYIPQDNTFIPPYTSGFSHPFSPSLTRLDIRFSPGPAGQLSRNDGQPVIATLYDVDVPDNSVAGSVDIAPGVFQIGGQGVTLVAVTGTAVALRSSQAVKVLMIVARTSNTGTIYIGSSTVTNNENALTGGLQMSPGDIITFTDTDIAHVFVNGTAGDGVSYMFWK